MNATRVTGAVNRRCGNRSDGMAAVLGSGAPSSGGVVAGNGPYVVFPTPSPSAVAVVSTATTSTVHRPIRHTDPARAISPESASDRGVLARSDGPAQIVLVAACWSR